MESEGHPQHHKRRALSFDQDRFVDILHHACQHSYDERSFSVLIRLKTYLRTTMLQDRLTSLAVLHVHRDIDIDIDMRSFTLGKSRHIDFGYGH